MFDLHGKSERSLTEIVKVLIVKNVTNTRRATAYILCRDLRTLTIRNPELKLDTTLKTNARKTYTYISLVVER